MEYKLEDIIFIDIETASEYETFEMAPKSIQAIWSKKYEKNEYLNQLPLEQSYMDKAAIFAEYGKVICISLGIWNKSSNEFRLKSFYGENEKHILESFSQFCHQLKKNYIFCGHNIREFDIPFLSRRCLVHFISIPSILNFQNKKPWEIEILDTMQYWKFGDYKNFTSLETLTTIFNLPTPKEDIDGSQVGVVYWKDKDIDRIVRYCQNDVVAVANLFRAFQQLNPIEPNQIIIATE